MGTAKNWTPEEEQYLADHWGIKSADAIAKHLNRTKTAIIVRVSRLGLGAFLESGDYITWNQFLIALGGRNGDSYKMTSWVKNRRFPIYTKKVRNNSFKVVYLDEFWKWAEENKDLLDFSKFEENILGKEPDWVKAKRKQDCELKRKYIKTPWTKIEDDRLRYLVGKQQYSYREISVMLGRTEGAIQRRLTDLGIKDRPIKADNHTKWTEEEFTLLAELIKAGYRYEAIAEHFSKSVKAIRGKVYSIYRTENLDKVRMIMT